MMEHSPSETGQWHGLPMGPVQALTLGLTMLAQDSAMAEVAQAHVVRAPAERVMTGGRQGFRVGELNLLISYAEGSELTDLLPTHHVPNAPGWFVGFCNLHGMAVPVIDLAMFFGLQLKEAFPQPMLLVLSRGADSTAIIIDGLPKRLRLDDPQLGDIDAAPPRVRGLLRQAYAIDGSYWFELDVYGLLDAIEQGMANSH